MGESTMPGPAATPLAAVLVLLGCAGAGDEAVLELGTGEVEFEPLEDYQRVPLVAGPQGGHHLWLSLRAEGLAAGPADLEIEAVPLTAAEPPPRKAPVRAHLRPSPAAAGTVELIGWPAQLAQPECLVGVPLSVRVVLTDERGHTASDERIVVPQSNPLLGECAP